MFPQTQNSIFVEICYISSLYYLYINKDFNSILYPSVKYRTSRKINSEFWKIKKTISHDNMVSKYTNKLWIFHYKIDVE